jgi:arginine/ornithine transport system substrate-binding protein
MNCGFSPYSDRSTQGKKVTMHRLTPLFLSLLILLGLALMAWPARHYIVPLKIGIEGNYPPFTQTAPDGRVTGFEVDLANDFCRHMWARCELINTKFDDLIPKLQNGELDAVMASLTITEKRLKEVDFSDSYYSVPSAWVAAKGVFSTLMPGTLAGKRVAVLKGSPRETWLRANYTELEIIAVAKETDVYTELAAKRADLVLTSMLVAKTKFLNQPAGKDFAVVGDGLYFSGGGGVGVALQKGNHRLRKLYNRAIDDSIRSGDYQTMAARYFDFNLIDRR